MQIEGDHYGKVIALNQGGDLYTHPRAMRALASHERFAHESVELQDYQRKGYT